jgi:hypothetical protein
MKVNRNQFKSTESGHSRIYDLNPTGILCHEGMHFFDDHVMVHLVFWKPLSTEQEKIFLKLVTHKYPKQLLSKTVLGDGEYQFELKYEELL